MIDINAIVKVCDQSIAINPARIIASYSHIVPIILSLILGIFVFIKTKFNFFSKAFLIFIIVFCFWLIGDVISWTSDNYTLVYTTWSFLDYFEIAFYVLGLYFAIVFVRKSDISKLFKFSLFALTVPALYLTLTKQSVLGFYSTVCEAENSSFLGIYKLIIEGVILFIILFYAIIPFVKKYPWKEKKNSLIMLGSMFLFLSVFGVTEYISSITGVYEINLYSLFLLPIFLLVIIYAVFELDIFNVKLLGTHYLVVGLLVLIAGQLFFIKGVADQWLTILSIIITAGLSLILFRNVKRESDQRVHIEKLSVDLEKSKLRLEDSNIKLESLASQRENFIRFLSHEVKGILGKNKNMFSMILENNSNTGTEQMGSFIKRSAVDTNSAIEMVENILNSNDVKDGKINIKMEPFDMKSAVFKAIENLKFNVETKKLFIKTDIDETQEYPVLGDKENITNHVIHNLIDNAICYTQKGGLTISLIKKDGKVIFSIKDTGVGITKEDMAKLFTEGGHGKDSTKTNVHSTGYGLFFAKSIVDAHKGKVWAESEGGGMGSTFFLELPTHSV